MTQMCRKCGACCRELILEVSGLDVLREPLWRKFIEPYWGVDYFGWRDNPEDVVFKVVSPGPCPFLDADRLCAIYRQRPDMCVRFRAGLDERCAFNPKCVFDYRQPPRGA
jgi:Fe-S-cluster containining protein